MNKDIKIACFALLTVFLALALVMASSNNHLENSTNGKHNESENNHNKTEKFERRLNFGLCVSNCTEDKFVCHTETESNGRSCLQAIKDSVNGLNKTQINRTAVKQAFRSCLNTHKEEIKVCKHEFHSCKDSCEQFKCKENQVFLNSTNTCYNTCTIDSDCGDHKICQNNICVKKPRNQTHSGNSSNEED